MKESRTDKNIKLRLKEIEAEIEHHQDRVAKYQAVVDDAQVDLDNARNDLGIVLTKKDVLMSLLADPEPTATPAPAAPRKRKAKADTKPADDAQKAHVDVTRTVKCKECGHEGHPLVSGDSAFCGNPACGEKIKQ